MLKTCFLQGLFTEGFFWIPSLGGPTSIAARQSGSGISWLFPFVVMRKSRNIPEYIFSCDNYFIIHLAFHAIESLLCNEPYHIGV